MDGFQINRQTCLILEEKAAKLGVVFLRVNLYIGLSSQNECFGGVLSLGTDAQGLIVGSIRRHLLRYGDGHRN